MTSWWVLEHKGSRTIAPKKIVLQISPRIIAPRPRTITPEDNCPRGLASDNCSPHNYPRGNPPPDNCSQGNLVPGNCSPPPHHKISLENNCPYSHKFPQRVLQVNWGKQYIVSEYCSLGVKSDLLLYILYRF